MSPLLAGAALNAGWSNAQIFNAAVVPALIAGAAVVVLAMRRRNKSKGI